MLGPGNARRQVREDEVVPAVISDHPIGAGEVDADLPFLVGDLAFERGDLDGIERPRIAYAAVDAVDTVHAGTCCLSGCAAANASSLFAFSSARSNVG